MSEPRITLEQWRALLAVVDAGGYAPAAEALGKSQSAVSYAIQKLETTLDLRAFTLKGRKAALTPAGELLYRRARALLAEAEALEQAAAHLSLRHEAAIQVAVEALFPHWLMLDCLAELGDAFPDTRIELFETVLTGTDEALLERRVDLAIAGRIPPGFLGDHLMRVRFVPVAHPDHPLHQLNRLLDFNDLRRHRQLVVRDSGQRRVDAGWLGAEQRWTVSHVSSSIQAACRGQGFAWYPEEKIRRELASGELKLLPLREGGERFADLYLVYGDRDYAGPATRRLGDILTRRTRTLCEQEDKTHEGR
ncbi:LysR family transcriptional regulator [Isoalcanivorax indicus]|uniref:LysR family transcriptional regulator n=1 Tax=Isoalcanivorax indicus TaxID=2202653 RepID=UPI000DBA733E|nr:LysR family transcriptional regulator [Isoalcanivorax indicus]